ncbi:hypothetical protein EZV62_023772 [Acer yangbiense]|uniref:Uncharacterized protein n=1 Tax=Acer yangbiense TaxID=1000413 RepID=A0A5C7H2S1_9ROSI|nr:hypothetical protein EZV62_023772 [Acer yangbiense]
MIALVSSKSLRRSDTYPEETRRSKSSASEVVRVDPENAVGFHVSIFPSDILEVFDVKQIRMVTGRINNNNFNGSIPDFIQNWKGLKRP